MSKSKKWYRNRTIQGSIIIGIFSILLYVIEAVFPLPRRRNPQPVPALRDTSIVTNGGNSVPLSKYVRNIQGPKYLSKILEKYPPLQTQEIYEKFYLGGIVEWKGTIRTMKRMELDTLQLFLVILEHKDGGLFSATFSNKWEQKLGTLNRGDVILVRGKLDKFAIVFSLRDCEILEK